MSAEEAANIPLLIWFVGLVLGIFVVGVVRSGADHNEEGEDTKTGIAIFCVVIWPVLAFTTVAGVILFGPFALVYWVGHFIGKAIKARAALSEKSGT